MDKRTTLAALGSIAGALFGITQGLASDNSFRITELYSNLDGSIQFVQLRESAGLNGQHHLQGLSLRSTHKGRTKEFVFPADLPSDLTANEWVLIATTDCVPFYGFLLEAGGEWNCLPADIRIPERFLPTDGGSVDFLGVDRRTFEALPTDGAKALDRDGNLLPATARAFQTPRVIVAYDASDPNNFVPYWLATPVWVTPTPVTAVEFYYARLDHYFISASAPDLDAIESAEAGGWVPTGQSFAVWGGPTGYVLSYEGYGGRSYASAFGTPICRFYIPPTEGDSHFFSANPDECAAVASRFPEFHLETPSAFYVRRYSGRVPQGADCVASEFGMPVYRLWNGRADTNHRYVTDLTIRDQMVALGWIKEGDGPNAIAFCASW